MAGLSVAQMLPALDGGGVERGALEVAQALVRRGHRSVVIAAGGRLVEELLQTGSEHLCWPIGHKSPLTLRWVLPLRRWLREQRIDILHARSRLPAWIAWLAWRGMDPACRPRLVTTVHGLYSVSAYSAIMTRGERVIAVSDTVRDYLARHYPKLSAERVQVIYRGVDPVAFPYGYRPAPTWLARWYADYPHLRDAFVITLPGRLTRLKGHEDFIRLLARLKAQGLPVRGLIVGGEDPRRRRYAQTLRQQVTALRLAEDIIFTGQRADIRDIYAASNLVLSLSTKPESFGRTVLEALSLGVPVIGYDHGGVGEVLGQVYPRGRVSLSDATALERRVMEFSGAAPKVAHQQLFPLRRMLDETLALYENLWTAS